MESISATLWELALVADSRFRVTTPERKVEHDELLTQADDLARILDGLADAHEIIAIATTCPITTIVSLLAVSRAGRCGALVGGVGYLNERTIVSLAPSVLIRDQIGTTAPVPTGYSDVERSGQAKPSKEYDVLISDLAGLRSAPDRWPRGRSTRRPFLLFRTSGTSGDAKWVVHSEESLAASLQSRALGLARDIDESALKNDDRSIMDTIARSPRAVFVGLDAISGYTQLCHCLWTGCPLVSMATLFVRRALRLASSTNAGTIVITPAILRLMLTLPDVERLSWTALGVIGIGGGNLSPRLLAEAEQVFGARVIQGYGSTEMGGAVVNNRVQDSSEVRAQTAGSPLAGVEVLIKGSNGLPMALGEQGEIVVRAPRRMALGYLATGSQPTFHSIRSDLYYHTGDVGVLRSDGNLTILGRIDDCIIRNDVKFFPQEVEAVLEEHPRVLRALVTARNRLDGLVEVKALCEVRGSISFVTASEIRGWCERQLGRPRCPDVIEFGPVERTMNGKVRRSAPVNKRSPQADPLFAGG